MKHPSLRVRNVLDLDKSVLDELEELGRSIIDLLPYKPIDVEIVGSLANGCSTLHSDIDIGMPCKDWNEQILLRRALYGPDTRLLESVEALIKVFNDKYGEMLIDFNPVNPDAKQDTKYATYSLLERKLYNELADNTHYWLSFSPTTQRYVFRPYEAVGTAIPIISKFEIRALTEPQKHSADPFIKEVPKWREIYGDKFIEYKVLPDGSLSE